MRILPLTATSLVLLALPVLATAQDGRGGELFKSLGCKGCHQLAGTGGNIGPALDGVGKRLNAEQIRQELVNPKADDPKSPMPSYQGLPPADLQALVEFLGSRK